MYPVMLDVRDQRCLVVGGGGVAARKVDGLLAEGADVVVVATAPHASIQRLAELRRVRLEQRAYAAGEAAQGYALVFAATDDREVNRRVFDDARGAGVWVNVADDPELCTFHLPARVQRGPLQLAIASTGEAPFVVRRLRQLLERRFGPEWGEWVDAAARFRDAVRTNVAEPEARERCYDRFFFSTVNGQRLDTRVPSPEEERAMIAGSGAAAPAPRERAAARTPATRAWPPTGGFVSLVGGGPGDPGLLTTRGRQRLLAAQAIAYDRLAASALPPDLPADVELHGVGKTAGRHPVPQAQINALLIRLAREGKRVVRLKGGDPFVFGRGGEEAEALREAGVPFEIVPGITAGVAVPAYAGIPVTHRSEVVRLTFVTAHEAIKREGPQVRWDLMAGDPHATIVGYMGVTSLPRVVEQLLAAGLDPETPAAMIERGTTSRQRVARGTVRTLPEVVVREGIKPPALFAIGSAVRHAALLDWFGERPLHGQRLGVLAPAGAIAEPLELCGAELVAVPRPFTAAARVVVGAAPLTGWIFRSADEVEAVEEERDGPGWSAEVVAWCTSEQAAERARARRWERVERAADAADLVHALLRFTS